MRTLYLTVSSAFILTACGTSESTSVNTGNSTAELTNNISKSNITKTYILKSDENNKLKWTGSAVGKEHFGSVNFDGFVNVENGILKTGEITFDLTSISSQDLEGEWKQKLDAHLKDSAFFFTKKYPTASLKITNYDGSNITGDLKIKDVTKKIIFPATVIIADTAFISTSSFKIDRTEYGIEYGSAKFFDLAKDKLISDEVKFDISLNTQN